MAAQQALVCGVSPEGERFHFVTIDFADGRMVHLSDPMTESVVRAEFKERGVADVAAERIIASARANTTELNPGMRGGRPR